MVWIGRIAVVISMAIGLFFTWDDLLGIGGAGGFTFIQKYTGFISPGVLAVFLLGMFWKRTNGLASIVGIVGGFVLCVFFNEFAPALLGHNTWFYTAYPNGHGGYEIPFLICMGLAFGFTVVLMVICSMFSPKVNAKAFVIDRKMYKVEPSVLVLIVVIMMLFAALYAKFW
jgi:SSS family solute:Na+ symporter